MSHIHEKIDWTVTAYIMFGNKVLLRKHDKYDIWVGVGGHIELDEDPVTAVIRECKEEVGLDITIYDGGDRSIEMEQRMRYLPPPAHMNIHYVGGTEHQHIDLIYYATSDSDAVVPEASTDKWVWLTEDEVTSHPDLSPRTKGYALGALNVLGTDE